MSGIRLIASDRAFLAVEVVGEGQPAVLLHSNHDAGTITMVDWRSMTVRRDFAMAKGPETRCCSSEAALLDAPGELPWIVDVPALVAQADFVPVVTREVRRRTRVVAFQTHRHPIALCVATVVAAPFGIAHQAKRAAW